MLVWVISEKQYEITKAHLLEQIRDSEQKNSEKIKNFEHDYKNTLIVLSGYLTRKQYDAGTEFLSELIKYSHNTFDSHNYSDIYKIQNLEIQNYLLNFVSTCREKSVTFSLSVLGTPYLLGINPIDITRMISIITNNALEACEDYESPSIEATFEFFSDKMILIVSNTFTENIPINRISEKNFSTKQHHAGRGLSILRTILKEFGSTFEIEYDSKRFTLTITIPK